MRNLVTLSPVNYSKGSFTLNDHSDMFGENPLYKPMPMSIKSYYSAFDQLTIVKFTKSKIKAKLWIFKLLARQRFEVKKVIMIIFIFSSNCVIW